MFLIPIFYCSKEQIAKEINAESLYNRICSIVRNSASDYTPEWKEIKNKILAGKDTVFMMENPDFKISVIVRSQFISDTGKSAEVTPKGKDPNKGSWR